MGVKKSKVKLIAMVGSGLLIGALLIVGYFWYNGHYFVATDDPIINISRVRNRVRLGGHPVPDDKVIARYGRSLDLLLEAIRHTNRAYIFDNSGSAQILLAEVSDGKTLTMKTDQMPAWFKTAVWEKVKSDQTL